MQCPICSGQMMPVFTTMVCENDCERRESKIAEALYQAAIDDGFLSIPWDEAEEETKEFFTRFARAAARAISE